MSIQHCLMPKRIFKVGKMIKKDGSEGTEVLYRAYDTKYVYMQNGKWINVSRRENQHEVYKLRMKYNLIDGITVPCGKCHYCKLIKSYDRAKQAWCDSKYFKYQYFITITYDDEHLPMTDFCNSDGCIERVPVLSKNDIKHFKEILRDRARKRKYQKIEYMLSGEYGEQNGRPHYHMILLTDDPEIELTLYPAGRTRTGYNLYGSKALDDIWQKGIIKLSKASTACMAYTARYTMKKAYKGNEKAERMKYLEYQQEFITSTPGIGYRYLKEHLDQILEKPSLQLPQTKGVSLPRYFINKLEKMGYTDWVKTLKEDNIARQNNCIKDTEKMHNMHYDEFVKHQQFKITKKQYEM